MAIVNLVYFDIETLQGISESPRYQIQVRKFPHISFSEWNSIESIELVEDYF